MRRLTALLHRAAAWLRDYRVWVHEVASNQRIATTDY